MSYTVHDDDLYETFVTHRSCTTCNDDFRKCNGMCNAQTGVGRRRRSDAEVARIKADRRRAHEDAVIAKAEQIMRRREPGR